MNVLMRKDVKWQWEMEQQKAFDKLKKVFTTKPVLAAPDLDKEFRVDVKDGIPEEGDINDNQKTHSVLE